MPKLLALWLIGLLLLSGCHKKTETPTPSPTAVRVQASDVQPLTATPSSPTNTPMPPTATPRPSTATPHPPTSTPRPPTNTPLPPSPTPRPTMIPTPTATPLPTLVATPSEMPPRRLDAGTLEEIIAGYSALLLLDSSATLADELRLAVESAKMDDSAAATYLGVTESLLAGIAEFFGRSAPVEELESLWVRADSATARMRAIADGWRSGELSAKYVAEALPPVQLQIASLVDTLGEYLKQAGVAEQELVALRDEAQAEIEALAERVDEPEDEEPNIQVNAPQGARFLENLSIQQERGGVLLRVKEVGLIPYAAMLAWLDDAEADRLKAELGDGPLTLGLLNVEAVNNTQEVIRIHPEQAVVLAEDEQVNTSPALSEVVGGELRAGERREGFILFALVHTRAETVDSIRYSVAAPSDANGQSLAAAGYELLIPFPK